MKIGCTSLILYFVCCEYYMHSTYLNLVIVWTASNEDVRNLPLVKKAKSPWEYFLKSARSVRVTNKGKDNNKGKTVERSLAEADTSTRGRLRGYMRWTSKQNEDLIRYFYAYQAMGAFKGPVGLRDWKRIFAPWRVKYGNINRERFKTHGFFLRNKMHKAAENFDVHHPIKYDIGWTAWLNDDLMKIYYTTESGDKSKHGERMRAEWVRMRYPCYQNVAPEYLLNRAEAMLQIVKKNSSVNPESEEPVDCRLGQDIVWSEDHDNFLEQLWKKHSPKKRHRKEKIFNDAVAKFKELESLGSLRVYQHARRLHAKNRISDGSLEEGMHKGENQEFIVDGHVNWKPYHDKYLLKLWEEEENHKDSRMERMHYKAVQKYSELNELNAGQVYNRARYMKKKAGKAIKVKSPYQEMIPGTQGQYHTFIDDQIIPSLNQERVASTSSQPGPSHGQLDPQLGLETVNTEGQSPDTNLRLG